MVARALMAALAILMASVAAASSFEGPCLAPGAMPRQTKLPHGVVSVTAEEFGADATGATDSTAALQKALVASRTDNITLFVPLGCYKVTDTLLATEPRNGRWQPTVIVGETPGPDGRRPTFVLPPATPGFTNKAKFRPVMAFWTNWCLSYGPEENKTFKDSWCKPGHGASMGPYLFNMVLQGVDFIIHEGNPGAVGVYMVGAQGSTIQDISVFAAPDALAGVAGGNGGGGVFVGVTVVGARYGLYARRTDGSATYTAFTLVNQTCAGMLVGPGTGSTNAMVGMHVTGSPSMGGVVAAANMPGPSSPCFGPIPKGGWRPDGPFLRDTLKTKESGAEVLRDPVSLVDVSFTLTGSAPCVQTGGSLWVQNMYSKGCSEVVVSGGKVVASAKSGSHAHIVELALGRGHSDGNSDASYKYSFPTIIDGKRSEDIFMTTDHESAPSDLQSKHHWGASSADWQSSGAVNVLELGAKGDGLTDDWKVLQNALDAHLVVVLPQGLYRLSKPLVMRRRGSALIGVGDTHSFIMPVSKGFQPQGQPVLDMMAQDATVKGISIVTWSHLASTYAIRWSGNGIWRQSFTTREPESVFPPFKAFGQLSKTLPPFAAPVNYDRPLVVISGGGAFYDFDLDFGCCFGHVVNAQTQGPEIASNDEVLLQRPGFRTLLINGSTSGLRFYPHNTEQAFSDAYTEIAFSTNVTLFNAKSENNYAVLWIRDSDLVTVHGYGGNACPFPNTTKYNEADIRGPVKGYAEFMPSSFRVQRSTRVTLANIVNQQRIVAETGFVSAGNGYDPHLYNMILQQDIEGFCDPNTTPDKCTASPVMDRPVLWRWDGSADASEPIAV